MRRRKREDARNRFSEVVRRAMADGPQHVTRGGRDAVVVVAATEYEALVAPENPVDVLRASPLAKAMAAGALMLERSRELPRDLPL